MLARRQRLFLVTPLMLLLVPFLLWPALLGILSSFTDYSPIDGQVHFVGLRNYIMVLADSQLRAAFRNVAVFAVTALPIELILGLAIAYALRERFRGRGVVRVLLLVPWLVSPIATGVMWHFLFNSSVGLVNFWLAWLRLPLQPSPLGLSGWSLPTVIVIDIWRKAPLVSFLLLPGLLALPSDLWEQATLDGTSFLSRVVHVLVPWLRPLLLTIALVLIGDTLGTFEGILMLTGGGPGSQTLLPALYSFQHAFQAHNWPVGVTSAWLIVTAVLVVGLGYLTVVRTELAFGGAE